MAEAKNYNSQKIRGMEYHTHAQESTLVHHLLVILENYTPLMTNIPPAPAIVTCRSRTTTPGMPPRQHVELHFPEGIVKEPGVKELGSIRTTRPVTRHWTWLS